jgi:hypothetical protein
MNHFTLYIKMNINGELHAKLGNSNLDEYIYIKEMPFFNSTNKYFVIYKINQPLKKENEIVDSYYQSIQTEISNFQSILLSNDIKTTLKSKIIYTASPPLRSQKRCSSTIPYLCC